MKINKTQAGVLVAALAAFAASIPALAPVLSSKQAVWVLVATNILSAILGKVQGDAPKE